MPYAPQGVEGLDDEDNDDEFITEIPLKKLTVG
jgi:hypothetical protein